MIKIADDTDITNAEAYKLPTAEAVNNWVEANYITDLDSASLIVTSNDGATLAPTYNKYVDHREIKVINYSASWDKIPASVNPTITVSIGADVGQFLMCEVDSVGFVLAEVIADNPAQIQIQATFQTNDSIKLFGSLIDS